MSKYELKTKATTVSPTAFINAVSSESARKDCKALVTLMSKITGEKPKMWGPSIIGFGKYHYKYESGHEGDMCIAGFSPRKGALSIYLAPGMDKAKPLFDKLGKHRMGKSCLSVKRLEDIDMAVLEKLIDMSVKFARAKYPS